MFNMEFDRKNAIISFLKENEGQKFTPYSIAKWLVENYPKEKLDAKQIQVEIRE